MAAHDGSQPREFSEHLIVLVADFGDLLDQGLNIQRGKDPDAIDFSGGVPGRLFIDIRLESLEVEDGESTEQGAFKAIYKRNHAGIQQSGASAHVSYQKLPLTSFRTLSVINSVHNPFFCSKATRTAFLCSPLLQACIQPRLGM